MLDDERNEMSLDVCRYDVWSKTVKDIECRGQAVLKHAQVGLGRSGEYVTDRPIHPAGIIPAKRCPRPASRTGPWGCDWRYAWQDDAGEFPDWQQRTAWEQQMALATDLTPMRLAGE